MLGLADDVEAIPKTVDEKDVAVAGRTVEDAGALGAAEAGVAGLIFLVHVGLDLDDAPAQPLSIDLVHQVTADERGGDGQAILGVEAARQARHQ
jgi:hypothetical protein